MMFFDCATPVATSRSRTWKKNQRSAVPFADDNLVGLSRNNVASNVPYSFGSEHQDTAPVRKDTLRRSKTQESARKDASRTSSVKQQCEAAVEKWLLPWREIYPHMKPLDRSALGASTRGVLAAKKEPSCHTTDERTLVMTTLAPLISHHRNKVALMAPLSGPHAAVGKGVITGIQLALAEAGLDPAATLITLDAEEWNNDAAMTGRKNRNDKLDEQLATALVHHGASVLIAAVDMTSEHHLITRSRELDFPLFLLANGSPDADLRGTPTFRIVPNLEAMGLALANTARNRLIRKIAVLKPSDGRSDAMIDTFVKSFTASGGAVSFLGSYTAGSYESMDAVVQSAFKINASERRGELEQLFQQRKQEAKMAGEPFNPKLVILPPQSDFDAVFLPDDFRTVRHFAKIFRFHGVKSMPLMGHQGWRSRGLIDPYDRFLDGAVFVDYVGTYGQLPAPLSAAAYTDPDNSWFIVPEFASALDFQLIGYRAATIALIALKNPGEKRRNLADLIRRAPNRQNGYFAAPSNFDEHQKALWPSFLFSVSDGNLNLHSTPAMVNFKDSSALRASISPGP